MTEFLSHAFALVCGQNPDHNWTLGSLALPCCQRCTGLYVGAFVALVLHLWLMPRVSGRFLEAHGLLLLQMVPFGFHWLPQGPVLRTITGLLFGFGLVTFLWLRPANRLRVERQAERQKTHLYWVGLVASAVLVPTAAAQGGVLTALALSGAVSAGAAVLLALVIANIGLWLMAICLTSHTTKAPRSPDENDSRHAFRVAR